MFAMQPKGLFGRRRGIGQGILPGDQPDFDMGDFPGAPQAVPMPQSLPQTGHAGRRRGGLFGSGVAAGDVLYALGGALAGDGGAAVSEIRERRTAPLLEQAKRDAEFADWRRKKQWERDNPAPANNDTINDWNFYNSLDEPGKQRYLEYLDQTRPIVSTDATGRPHVTRRVQQAPTPVEIDPSDWDSAAPLTTGGPAPVGRPPFARNAGVAGDRLDHITMMSESGGNPNAVSPKGARGLMQVMPATARDPGFGIRPSNGTPEDDVRVGREYRRAMQQRYNNNLPRMWAAYNAGPGRVDDLIERYGERWLDYAPAETRAYVARNMRAARGN